MINPPPAALKILKTLQDKGFRAYLVGGCVRDALLGKRPEEWDITTSAKPEEITNLFLKVIPTGIDFGTVTVLVENEKYEVTTFRSDERYLDGRHPAKVTYTADLSKDLARRDFTINAITYDPIENELIDNFDGQKDLKEKIIRSVGNAEERFAEDGLRPLRACRFAAKLDFGIEKKTFDAISKSLKTFKKVAPERIHDEIIKMLKTGKPSIGIDFMQQSGLLKLVMPELEEGIGVEQPKPFHIYDVYYHNLYTCDALPKDRPILRLAGLFHDIAKPRCKQEMTFYNHDRVGVETAEAILKRLKFSNADIDKVTRLIKNHMFDYQSQWKDPAVRRFMRRIGLDLLEDLFWLRRADLKAMEKEVSAEHLKELRQRIDKVIEEENALDVTDLEVDGKDVMEVLSIPPGPKIGKVLNELLEKVLDDPSLNQKDKLLELIKKYAD